MSKLKTQRSEENYLRFYILLAGGLTLVPNPLTASKGYFLLYYVL